MIQLDMYRNAQYPLTGYGKDWSMGGGAFSAQTVFFRALPEFELVIWNIVWMPSMAIRKWFNREYKHGYLRLCHAEQNMKNRKVIMEIDSDIKSPVNWAFNITESFQVGQYFVEGKGNPAIYSSSLEII